MKPFIYFRALKHAEHTVFCVQDGQKTYYDNQFGRRLAYSSGQQVKRSILDTLTSFLNVQVAPITFNYVISKKSVSESKVVETASLFDDVRISKKSITESKEPLSPKEPWSPCDPSYVDQLLGGWMKAASGGGTLKRRSPLSISAMRPLHPLLAGTATENITFDRSDRPDIHPVIVRREGEDKPLSEEEIENFLSENDRTLSRRIWIPADKKGSNTRTTGLFVYDVAIDLRTLFCVSTNQHEPELSKEKIEDLKKQGWKESENAFGKCLIAPAETRVKVIPALANSLINWRITSNQARTFSLMETLAIAISDNANKIAASIRAKLKEEEEKAEPIVDDTIDGVSTYITLPAAGYIRTKTESIDALEMAEKKLINMMNAFDYENQNLKPLYSE